MPSNLFPYKTHVQFFVAISHAIILIIAELCMLENNVFYHTGPQFRWQVKVEEVLSGFSGHF